MTIKRDEQDARLIRWLDANCAHLGMEKYSSLTARLEAVEKERDEQVSAYVSCLNKLGAVEKENAELRAEVEDVKAKAAVGCVNCDPFWAERAEFESTQEIGEPGNLHVRIFRETDKGDNNDE